ACLSPVCYRHGVVPEQARDDDVSGAGVLRCRYHFMYTRLYRHIPGIHGNKTACQSSDLCRPAVKLLR
ncbi:MAG: hypothetical protein J4N80_11620, partial [Chloroflexi bacterium]|nr:hypothetical protein [Chloroflexota bacterium]